MANKKKQTINAAHVAVITHFDRTYGKNDDILGSWQRLCRDVGVVEGTSITQCKKNLRGTFVNIVDFVHAKRNGTPVPTFASAGALGAYMRNAGSGKILSAQKGEGEQDLEMDADSRAVKHNQWSYVRGGYPSVRWNCSTGRQLAEGR